LFYHSYENSFAGLGKRLDQAARTNAAMQMVLIHGMGDHCPGYGDIFANNIAKQLKLTRQGQDAALIPLVSSIGATNWLREFSYSSPPRVLNVYELTWTPTTHSLKTNAFAKDRRLIPKRVKINKDLKNQVMEEGFGDAILYLNPSFRPKMQEPIRQTIDRVEKHAGPNDKIVLVASSLGSKMTFDTVEEWASEDRKVKHFAGRTSDILMLANQLPLLHLAAGSNVFEHPHETSVKAFVRISRAQQQKAPQPPDSEDTNWFNINVVAATDPNDLLSYPLRDEDVVPDDPEDEGQVKVVVSNIYSHNAWAIPFLFEHPGNAHTDYDQNQWLIKRLVRGFANKKDPLPKAVPDTFSCELNPKKHL